MRRFTTGGRLTALVLTICAVFVCGCARLNAPRIDPSGRRIFAQPLIGDQPVYREVPRSSTATSGMQLLLCPHETIAPVGSEVVLLAGVRAADGYLRTNQRVEWVLDPGGPGQFVEVGQGTPIDYLVCDFTRPRKVSNTFAIGSTSRRYLRLTRGTALPADDVYVLSGQAWISVTSPREGTSQVAAYARGIDDWSLRKQIATIHWVDAQWSFPPPAINSAGGTHLFTTTVTRQTDQSPCVNWLVRYEILDGPAAGFSPDGVQVVEVPTDSSGQASAEIFQQQAAPGTNKIGVQVIRPADVNGKGKRFEVGSGTTLMTWSAADVGVRKTGPAVGSLGATLTYRIEVFNPGDLSADEVTLSDRIPPGLTYLRSDPPAEEIGGLLQWRLGSLSAGDTRSVEVDCRADRLGSVMNSAEVTAAGGLTAADSASTSVVAPGLELSMEGPDQAVVGQNVIFQTKVTNVGQVAASGLVINDRFDPGLQHAQVRGQLIQKKLDKTPAPGEPAWVLAPGESQWIDVELRVVQAGRLCNTMEILVGGEVVATTQKCITAVVQTGAVREQPGPGPQPPPEPQPGLAAEPANVSVDMMGPVVSPVGQTAQFVIEVMNQGRQPLTNVQVVDEFDREFEPTGASDGYAERPPDNPLAPFVWTIDQLQPGKMHRYKFQARCLSPAAAACNRVTVISSQGAAIAEDRVYVEIRQAPAMPAPTGANLDVSIEDIHDPIDLNKTKTFTIRVVNTGMVDDHNLTLTVAIPAEMDPIKFKTTGPPSSGSPKFEGRIVRFAPVDTIKPGDILEYRVGVAAKQAGLDVALLVELTSQSLPQGKQVQERTIINPPPLRETPGPGSP